MTAFVGHGAADTGWSESAIFRLNTILTSPSAQGESAIFRVETAFQRPSVAAASNTFRLRTSGVRWDAGVGDSDLFAINTIGVGLEEQIRVTPEVPPETSIDFGPVEADGVGVERVFTVTNVGQGTLNGTASVEAIESPFSIASGASYSLAAGHSQTVIVRYAPTSPGEHQAFLLFRGGTGALRKVSGSAYVTPNFGSITGTVTDQLFGTPLTGARVSAGGQTVYSWLGGNYTITGLAPGTYSVTASCPSFYAATLPDVRVTASQQTAAPNIALERATIVATDPLDVPVVLVRGRGRNQNWNDPDPKKCEEAYWHGMRTGLVLDYHFRRVWDCNDPSLGYPDCINGEQGIAPNAGSLYTFLAQHIRALPDPKPDRINIVAHSMGGLITRAFLKDYASRLPVPVDKVVMIGTPNAGSVLADYRFWPEGWDSTSNLQTSYIRIPFRFNYPWESPDTALYSLAGTTPLGEWDWDLWMGDFLIRLHSDPFDWVNDGAVTLKSTKGEYFGGNAFPGANPRAEETALLNHYHIACDPGTVFWVAGILKDTYQPLASVSPESSPVVAVTSGHSSGELPLQQIEQIAGVWRGLGHNEIQVPSDASQRLMLALRFHSGDAEFSLRDPSGLLIDPGVAATDPDIEYQRFSDFDGATTTSLYQIQNPQTGFWTVQYDVTAAPLEATISVIGDSALSLVSDMDYYTPNAFEAPISCRLLDGSGETPVPVTDAQVSATVSAPDLTTYTLALFDDGIHSDGAAGDGQYGTTFAACQLPGEYDVVFRADGLTSEGLAFRRVAVGAFMVGASHDRILSVLSDEGFDTDGDGGTDLVRLQLLATVETSGTYSVCASLFNEPRNATVAGSEKVEYVPPGISTVSVYFNLGLLQGPDRMGPFRVEDLRLFKEEGGSLRWLDTYAGEYTTNTYSPPTRVDEWAFY